MEFSSVVFNGVYLEGRYQQTFKDIESSEDQFLASFSGSLFYWSRAWGLTSSDYLPLFLSSLSYLIFFFVILFFSFL